MLSEARRSLAVVQELLGKESDALRMMLQAGWRYPDDQLVCGTNPDLQEDPDDDIENYVGESLQPSLAHVIDLSHGAGWDLPALVHPRVLEEIDGDGSPMARYSAAASARIGALTQRSVALDGQLLAREETLTEQLSAELLLTLQYPEIQPGLRDLYDAVEESRRKVEADIQALHADVAEEYYDLVLGGQDPCPTLRIRGKDNLLTVYGWLRAHEALFEASSSARSQRRLVLVAQGGLVVTSALCCLGRAPAWGGGREHHAHEGALARLALARGVASVIARELAHQRQASPSSSSGRRRASRGVRRRLDR